MIETIFVHSSLLENLRKTMVSQVKWLVLLVGSTCWFLSSHETREIVTRWAQAQESYDRYSALRGGASANLIQWIH